MRRVFIRLDDACEKRDIDKWNRIEALLDKYHVRPLVGIIPCCKDPDMDKYVADKTFWTDTIARWKKKHWSFALHGYEHVFQTIDGGLNPVNKRSEFAGVSLQKQKEMIRQGVKVLREHNIEPNVFFAPAHTFDANTLRALKAESNILAISDTPANDCYYRYGFYFVPQQAGHVRYLPFRTVTYCYHPNTMTERDFEILENYLRKHKVNTFKIIKKKRKMSIYDILLMKAYYWRHSH